MSQRHYSLVLGAFTGWQSMTRDLMDGLLNRVIPDGPGPRRPPKWRRGKFGEKCIKDFARLFALSPDNEGARLLADYIIAEFWRVMNRRQRQIFAEFARGEVEGITYLVESGIAADILEPSREKLKLV
ncbi:MAG: hypothetical protein A3J48_04095 [Candidatus Doudnabacteria bacterium RIFCSPHIGHO2_02_FULL_46_11]|uniref:Uncharacterized protein n=1 Tax=Candidatus Doudnabacteria bacterium RIFCSPHIGHO2_02_FULL_46_11 TaxID=1817832 RepID=A0A1F5P6R1_9BACT|nr:MAG: hypothetical protein A3J48_04095 [Candidatus Doudnabacteria bacterium RIFCSPHIGHO2_02_FULL_46_11]